MTKESMLRSLPLWRTAIYYEYRSEGFTDSGAYEKTVKWYMRNYTLQEIKDMYDEFCEE